MKSVMFKSALCVVSLLSACGAAPVESAIAQEPSFETQTSELSQNGQIERRVVEQLKKRIVAIAKANQSRLDNLPAVEAELRPLIQLLVRLTPKRTLPETAALLEGPWYNWWTNQSFARSPVNLARIFQVVNKNGHYYNISEGSIPNGPTIIGALRGAYAQVPDGFAIRFTKNGFIPGALVGKTSADIAKLAVDFESGATPINQVPGPIGITGKLGTLYVDETLRIVSGDQTPVFDDNGVVSVPGVFGLLYVQERLVGPLP